MVVVGTPVGSIFVVVIKPRRWPRAHAAPTSSAVEAHANVVDESLGERLGGNAALQADGRERMRLQPRVRSKPMRLSSMKAWESGLVVMPLSKRMAEKAWRTELECDHPAFWWCQTAMRWPKKRGSQSEYWSSDWLMMFVVAWPVATISSAIVAQAGEVCRWNACRHHLCSGDDAPDEGRKSLALRSRVRSKRKPVMFVDGMPVGTIFVVMMMPQTKAERAWRSDLECDRSASRQPRECVVKAHEVGSEVGQPQANGILGSVWGRPGNWSSGSPKSERYPRRRVGPTWKLVIRQPQECVVKAHEVGSEVGQPQANGILGGVWGRPGNWSSGSPKMKLANPRRTVSSEACGADLEIGRQAAPRVCRERRTGLVVKLANPKRRAESAYGPNLECGQGPGKSEDMPWRTGTLMVESDSDDEDRQ
ncbi:hypothetical protein BT63DRAFT_416126 [Microthyrium microscopicum]|uniref:Uncharacterized protein n=1 Tax=Microthyrium microscopicum TaxID=703497 RepID=A0A6A6U465_9PEZI|nr:hypothetical protein BT63DRAFT_416126 [Microthyrium microscopicum]